MSYIYVTDNGSIISTKDNQIVITKGEEVLSKVPIDTVDNINIIGRSHMTTPCAIECLNRGIVVSYHSMGGNYYGKLENMNRVNVNLQRKQAMLYYETFALDIAKRIVGAKLRNQETILRRYGRNSGTDVTREIVMIANCYKGLKNASDVSRLMGYEGVGARNYFAGLSKLVVDDFKFGVRSKRPPKDEFNAMLSMGYTLIYNEIYGKLHNKGLNPYFGFLHSDKANHATLASDMMEEWRPIIVDSLVMSMINRHEILKTDFVRNADKTGVYFTKEGLKKFIAKLERKLETEVKYFEGLDVAVSFRKGLDIQINMLSKAISHEDASLYNPVIIR